MSNRLIAPFVVPVLLDLLIGAYALVRAPV